MRYESDSLLFVTETHYVFYQTGAELLNIV
jgi:hypothetical protein